MTFWMPTSLNQIVGNEATMELLRSLVASKDRAPRAYTFDGPNGCGKNTIARLFLESLLPEQRCITIGPERFGQILKQEDFSEYKCLVWDHADKLTKDQSEEVAALMDRSKSDQVFVFITTGRLEQCLRSRSLKVTCSRLSSNELSGLLSSICALNDINFDISAINILAKKADGVPSQGIVMLQAAAISGKLTQESVANVTDDLGDQCRELLRQLGTEEGMELASRIRNRYEFPAVVDCMFDTYSKAYVNKEVELLHKLSNYKRVGDIFLKWRSNSQVPSSALYLMIRELMESNNADPVTVVTPTAPVETKSAINRSRELTYSEMVELIAEGSVNGDIKIR